MFRLMQNQIDYAEKYSEKKIIIVHHANNAKIHFTKPPILANLCLQGSLSEIKEPGTMLLSKLKDALKRSIDWN